jgi:hypothetical protein
MELTMQQDAQETEVLDAEPQEVELEVELESSEPEQPTEPVEQTEGKTTVHL